MSDMKNLGVKLVLNSVYVVYGWPLTEGVIFNSEKECITEDESIEHDIIVSVLVHNSNVDKLIWQFSKNHTSRIMIFLLKKAENQGNETNKSDKSARKTLLPFH